MLHFEDFAAGAVFPLGARRIDRDEIVAFAERWDPQPMHLDEAAGAASMLGGLSASGWHTACVMMRLFVDGLLSKADSRGSPGIESLKWMRPVRPGDTLSADLTILDTRLSRSRPTIGLVRGRFETVDQNGAAVLVMIATVMMGTRAAA
ncbi:MaoC family dehydratase [Siculibacillus lacustris]|nr:MaoC family dehydratase [Siculibacillus lacustris]